MAANDRPFPGPLVGISICERCHLSCLFVPVPAEVEPHLTLAPVKGDARRTHAHPVLLGPGSSAMARRQASGRASPFREGWGEGRPRGEEGGTGPGFGLEAWPLPAHALSVGGACPLGLISKEQAVQQVRAVHPGHPPALSSPVPSGGTPPGSLGHQGHHTHREAAIPLPSPPLPPGLAVATATAGCGAVPRGWRGSRGGRRILPVPVTGPRTPGPSARGGSGSWLPRRGLRLCWLAAALLPGGPGSAGEGV